MLCQSCKKNEANTHIKKIINGKVEEYILCDECAKKMGYGNAFDDFNFNLDSFLGGLFSENMSSKIAHETLTCKSCGSSFDDISATGKVGCADCYTTFCDKLMPLIKRIHGNTNHSGKLACAASDEKKLENKITALKTELNEAVKEQNFELAATLRDKIKELESGVKKHD